MGKQSAPSQKQHDVADLFADIISLLKKFMKTGFEMPPLTEFGGSEHERSFIDRAKEVTTFKTVAQGS